MTNNDNDTTILWSMITSDEITKYIVKNISDNDRIFLTKVYQNDFEFIRRNCKTFDNIVVILLISVMYVDTVDILIFIMNVIKPHVSDIDKIVDAFGNNCLLLSCYKNPNVAIIKYLIEEMNMSINHCNKRKQNCLNIACINNVNLEIIKYLVEKTFDLTSKCDIFGRNCLMNACYKNSNVAIIKYLIDDVKMNITIHDSRHNNCLILACARNICVDVIKYLIEERKLDASHCNRLGMNCLTIACLKNSNLDVIKYLIKSVKMNPNHLTNSKYNCLLLACEGNNLETVKYLIENVGVNTNCVTSKGHNCLTLACICNKDRNVIKYLVENTDIPLQLEKFNEILFSKSRELLTIFAECVMNTHSFNEFIKSLIIKYDSKIIRVVKNSVNPILLDEDVCNLTGMIYQFNNKCTYHKFVENVKKLKGSGILFKNIHSSCQKKEYVINKCQRSIIDVTEKPSVLFKNNGVSYYGYRKLVYDKIFVLNGLEDYSLDEPIVLNVAVAKYIMLMYVQSCYDGVFDLEMINPDNFHQFLNLIDKYPTKYLSMEAIEIPLIQYIALHNIPFDDEIKAICDRYRLKYMYLYANQKIKCI
jgi:ankyrin repeat protein